MARTRWHWRKVGRCFVALAWLRHRGVYACFVATPYRRGVAELRFIERTMLPERPTAPDVLTRIAEAAVTLVEPRAGPKLARGR